MLGLRAPDLGDGDTRGKNEGPWGGVGEENRERTGGGMGSWALALTEGSEGEMEQWTKKEQSDGRAEARMLPRQTFILEQGQGRYGPAACFCAACKLRMCFDIFK